MACGGEVYVPGWAGRIVGERASLPEIIEPVATERPADNISARVPENIYGHTGTGVPHLLNRHTITGSSGAGFGLEGRYIDLRDCGFTTTIGDIGELHNGNTVAVLNRL